MMLASVLAASFAALAGTAAPAGYVGKGQLVLRTALGASASAVALTLGGDIALEAKGEKLRVDLLDLGIPGADPTLSAVLSTQLIPPGGFTIVYDRSASTYTVWSNAKRAYYAGGGAAAKAAPAEGTGAGLAAAGDLLGAFAFARTLKDDSAFTVTLSLAGHGNVNGHPATGLDYQYARTTSAGDATDVRGRLQLADDLDGVPVEVTANLKIRSLPESALRLDLTSLLQANPPAADFAVPAGYARAPAIGDVLGTSLPF